MDAPATPTIDNLRQQASESFNAGDHDRALQLLKEAVQIEPQNPSLILDLAQLTFQSGNLSEAETLLAQLPEAAKNTREAKTLAAVFQFSQIVIDAPDLETVQATLQQDPKHLESRYQLAAYLMLHHQIEEAMECLITSIQIDKSDHNGRAQQLLLDIFGLLQSDHPQLVNTYRRQLQSLLY